MVKFEYVVYGKIRLSDESLLIVGFRERERAAEYLEFLKIKYPKGHFYIWRQEATQEASSLFEV